MPIAKTAFIHASNVVEWWPDGVVIEACQQATVGTLQ
jgi:hypothetical protein